MTLIIGASGRARHGKTDFCEAIKNYCGAHGYVAKIYDIGNLIRLHCIFHGLLPVVERADMTREQLQILIDVGKQERAKDVNFWISHMMSKIAEDGPNVALIPNIRYQNEAQAIKQAGGFIIRMKRVNHDGSTFISEDRPANDVSETNLEFWPADVYLTTVEGQQDLIRPLAVAVFEYFLEHGGQTHV